MKKTTQFDPVYLSMGIAIGSGVGVALGNLALGIAIGVSIGTALAMSAGKINPRESQEPPEDPTIPPRRPSE
ncbi:MAG: hypothetical protein R3B96_17820 [Pirellulaceae bacterium]